MNGGASRSGYDLRAALTAATPGVPDRQGWDTITVLVTVKAYPVVARKSGESVCVAGVRLDTEEPQWVRLFPVPFRALPRDRQFRKYDVIRLQARRQGGSDRRPETYRPNLDSLVVGPSVDSDNGTWKRRWRIVEPLAGQTTACSLAQSGALEGQAAPSLGMIKPHGVDLVIRDNPDYRPGGLPEVDVDLFGTEREVLEKTPFLAAYRYRCADASCPGHEQSIVDWESGQFARRNLVSVAPAEARERHRQRFLDELCAAGRDTHFFLGNQHQHPGSFLVLGVFWPPAGSRPQPALDL